jgi:hypothetical protein
MTPEKLTPRLIRRDIREYVTVENDYVIARKLGTGAWLVTAHSADLGAQVQGFVTFNESGFRGRQWESAIDGQQYSSLIEAIREAVSLVRRQADIAAFARSIEPTR